MATQIQNPPASKPGWTSDLTRAEIFTLVAYLRDLERKLPVVHYLEIGVFAGGTLSFLKQITSRVRFVGLDLFEDFIPSKENTHISGTYKMADVQQVVGSEVQLIKGDSALTLANMNARFDFIFIDGNHTYEGVKNDFVYSSRLLAPDGFIAFHNCSSYMDPDVEYAVIDGGPWRFIRELLERGEWVLDDSVDRVKVVRRRK